MVSRLFTNRNSAESFKSSACLRLASKAAKCLSPGSLVSVPPAVRQHPGRRDGEAAGGIFNSRIVCGCDEDERRFSPGRRSVHYRVGNKRFSRLVLPVPGGPLTACTCPYLVPREWHHALRNSQRDNWYPSLRVVIRGNVLENIGGDGIVPRACDGALVEYNIVRGGRMRAEDYAAGIWPGGCDNTVVQYNEVSGMKGTRDGEGYDSDFNCRGTCFQYNFSHNNDGGFMLVCNNGGVHMPKSIGNMNTIIRYNISVNDRLHTFNINGPCQNTLICNNVLYVGKKQSVNAFKSRTARIASRCLRLSAFSS